MQLPAWGNEYVFILRGVEPAAQTTTAGSLPAAPQLLLDIMPSASPELAFDLLQPLLFSNAVVNSLQMQSQNHGKGLKYQGIVVCASSKAPCGKQQKKLHLIKLKMMIRLSGFQLSVLRKYSCMSEQIHRALLCVWVCGVKNTRVKDSLIKLIINM